MTQVRRGRLWVPQPPAGNLWQTTSESEEVVADYRQIHDDRDGPHRPGTCGECDSSHWGIPKGVPIMDDDARWERAEKQYEKEKCAECGHTAPHSGGGIGVCLAEGCGCDGVYTTECFDHDCRKHAYDDPNCNHGADGCTIRTGSRKTAVDNTASEAEEEARAYERERTASFEDVPFPADDVAQDSWPGWYQVYDAEGNYSGVIWVRPRPDYQWLAGEGRILKEPSEFSGVLPAPPPVAVMVAGDIADDVRAYAERREAEKRNPWRGGYIISPIMVTKRRWWQFK